mgnify:CR=1 FL=1
MTPDHSRGAELQVVTGPILDGIMQLALSEMGEDPLVAWESESGVSSEIRFGARGGRYSSVRADIENRCVTLWLEDESSLWLELRAGPTSWSCQIFLPISQRLVIQWIRALAMGKVLVRKGASIEIAPRRLRLQSR